MAENNFVPESDVQPNNNKQSNPYWYRENASYLFGVTAMPSNPMFGIENIDLRPASADQLPHRIVANGTLRTVVGSFSFQIQNSKAGHPFVSTISTKMKTAEGQPERYWEHIILRPQTKAQILRFFEALASGQVPQQAVANPYGMQQATGGFGGFQQAGNPFGGGAVAGAQAINPFAGALQTAGVGAGTPAVTAGVSDDELPI